MRVVFIASPLAGDERTNKAYARAAMRDSLARGEAPFVPHLLYTQVLADNGDERRVGMRAGANVLKVCHALVVYTDRGISSGMSSEIAIAEKHGIPVEYRTVPGWLDDAQAESFQRLLGASREVFAPEVTEMSMKIPPGKNHAELQPDGTIAGLESESDEESFDDDDEPPAGPILGSA